MNRESASYRILHFFLTKIIIGIAVVGGFVALTELSFRFLLEKLQLTDDVKNSIVAIADTAAALSGYILLFRFYEKRKITELSFFSLGKNAVTGFLTGLILQSLFILIIYAAGGYTITNVNPASFLLPAFSTAFSAGFVAEILIRGIFFRLIEEKLGTMISLCILTILFAVMHVNAAGATILSVCSTAIAAGFLLSIVYVLTRSLWISIFLHFAWDFAEPGIFGGINPGNTITQSLFSSQINGSAFLTGGQTGPQNSIQALLLCSFTSLIFFWIARRRKSFLKPYWKK